jgi:hypothetical protein
MLHQIPADVIAFIGRQVEPAQLRLVGSESMADGVPMVVVAVVGIARMGSCASAVLNTPPLFRAPADYV